ncbi:unnamed protein product [Cuscuta epithymum]|uniref:Uncharacterized protein n=1 Tax=Cuscuta epithymum TaxID=186058 RepID=A0AAV0E2D7_9ASTE|nr:unnamed protein product [Cuscuta epithymum]CAH9125580.1 unnamed protein product [Cuscuta epithymum]
MHGVGLRFHLPTFEDLPTEARKAYTEDKQEGSKAKNHDPLRLTLTPGIHSDLVLEESRRGDNHTQTCRWKFPDRKEEEAVRWKMSARAGGENNSPTILRKYLARMKHNTSLWSAACFCLFSQLASNFFQDICALLSL